MRHCYLTMMTTTQVNELSSRYASLASDAASMRFEGTARMCGIAQAEEEEAGEKLEEAVDTLVTQTIARAHAAATRTVRGGLPVSHAAISAMIDPIMGVHTIGKGQVMKWATDLGVFHVGLEDGGDDSYWWWHSSNESGQVYDCGEADTIVDLVCAAGRA